MYILSQKVFANIAVVSMLIVTLFANPAAAKTLNVKAAMEKNNMRIEIVKEAIASLTQTMDFINETPKYKRTMNERRFALHIEESLEQNKSMLEVLEEYRLLLETLKKNCISEITN